MENLYIEETKYTPKIEFNIDGELTISGRSYPENTFDFYEPIFKWLEEFLKTTNKIVLNFDIIYFNSSTAKIFFTIFNMLKEAKKANKHVEVKWFYDIDNETIEDAGLDFVEDFKELDIKLITK